MKILLLLWYHTQMLCRRINWLIYKNKVTFKGKATLNYGSLMIGMNTKDQIVIGRNVDLHGCLSVGKKGKITIGDYALIGPRVLIQSEEKIEIGNFSYIAPDVLIMDTNHHSIYAADRMVDIFGVAKGISGINSIGKPIKIGNHVWLARRVMVFKGVTIGDRSVVGAGTVVTHDIPSDVVVAGSPAKIVKHIDQLAKNPDEIITPEEIIEMNKEEIVEMLKKRFKQ